VHQPDVDRLKRLLQILKSKNQSDEVWKNAEPSDLANAVRDWIDADSDVAQGGGGAEDSDYLQLERPYRAANALIASTSELLLVRGFTAAIYREVAPYVTALPERTLINVNTAKLEVLRTLDENITCVDVTKLGRDSEVLTAGTSSESTKAKPTVFTDPEKFLQDVGAGCKFDGFTRPPQAGNVTPPPAATGLEKPSEVLSVNTSYFQVNAYAEVGPEDHRVKVKLYSVLQRKNGKIATISRAQGFE
jgi:type II secretory pathway component PulK